MSMPSYNVLIIGLLVVLLGGVGYYLYETHETLTATQAELRATNETLAETRSELAATKENADRLQSTLVDVRDALASEEERNEAFEEQIDRITGTVDDLDKLSKTDEELLQKYSKVYFLNEHYEPADLEEIPDEYVYDKDTLYFIHEDVLPFLEDMMEEAEDDDIEMSVVSAYRSFTRQSILKGQYTQTYGTGANAFSADQGYSEHQLGTTVDFTTPELNGGMQGFENTEAYEWLTDNAHKYGFTLSYPEGNEYYVFEPWHWRFVGEKLAEDLHDEGDHFYDWDQRRLDEYLLNIFE